ncbi:hypothetical protein [Myroides odoratimimus]|nr:hypothetical protein [Myroides odoratimimus]
MSRGDITQYETLKGVDEVEFYSILKKFEERIKFEAEHPQLRF